MTTAAVLGFIAVCVWAVWFVWIYREGTPKPRTLNPVIIECDYVDITDRKRIA